MIVALALSGTSVAAADTVRIATWHADLGRDGPGVLLRDVLRGNDPDLDAIAGTIASAAPDILLLTRTDWDHRGAALDALRDRLSEAGQAYDHAFHLRPNVGVPTGVDIDGDGRLGTARDRQGWGRFTGDGGMALLSTRPLDLSGATDLGMILWRDLPGSLMRPEDTGRDVQRISTAGHWIVPVEAWEGTTLSLMAFHAGPPVFDGPEDRNGRRNADEIRLWQLAMDGTPGIPAPEGLPVVLGNANLDPHTGDGRRAAIGSLLADPRLQDPAPGTTSVDWSRLGLGEMRVSYVLPAAALRVAAAGAVTIESQEHRLVWVDVALPD